MPTNPTLITTNHLRAFLVHPSTGVTKGQNHPLKPITNKPISAFTVAAYDRTLKAFFSWAEREGHLERSPASLLKVPKVSHKVVQTLAQDQIRRLLAAIDLTKPNGFRDRCIVLPFLDRGIRLSELAHLETSKVDLQRGELSVMGKGSKERVVPIGATVQRALWKYIHCHRPIPAHEDVRNLFLSQQGYGLTPDRIYRLIANYGRRAGLRGVRCSPHTLRHTMAKNFLLNGSDLFTLQKILGHSGLDVVRLYVNLASEDVKIQHRKHSPVDLMRLDR
jgi:integrase/recombinase XerD